MNRIWLATKRLLSGTLAVVVVLVGLISGCSGENGTTLSQREPTGGTITFFKTFIENDLETGQKIPENNPLDLETAQKFAALVDAGRPNDSIPSEVDAAVTIRFKVDPPVVYEISFSAGTAKRHFESGETGETLVIDKKALADLLLADYQIGERLARILE